MQTIIVAGAGQIGCLAACLLASSGDYDVFLVDRAFKGEACQHVRSMQNIQCIELDFQDEKSTKQFFEKNKYDAILSCLPYFCNVAVADLAKQYGLHYFDLTEDVSVTEKIKAFAKGSERVFLPQCGVAPGFVDIVASHLIKKFDRVSQVKLRTGALPQQSSNPLHYALTWSVDGLINEYIQPCLALRDGQRVTLAPLTELEVLDIDGLTYEAFHTSGGLASLADTYKSRVKDMDYKTIRYPGHCEKMRALIDELDLTKNRDALKKTIEDMLPRTQQDVVLIYISVSGERSGELFEESYVKKIYPQEISGFNWTAIQVTTASSVCVLIDLVMKNPGKYQSLVLQEQFSLEEFLANRFGEFYR